VNNGTGLGSPNTVYAAGKKKTKGGLACIAIGMGNGVVVRQCLEFR